jgi:L-alanine-DL-glutamate epimerase-like enolase superfamily enzyme
MQIIYKVVEARPEEFALGLDTFQGWSRQQKRAFFRHAN